MNDPSSRVTLKQLSALGAGVLLAAAPHCGGKSEGSDDDSGGQHRGGASGSAGYGGSYGGVGAGAYGGIGVGGSYGGSYGGSIGTGGVGTGAYGGAVGMGGCSSTTTLCFTPAEMVSCFPDAGVDGGDDGAAGEDGAGGVAGEGPVEISIPRPPDAGGVDAGVDAGDVPEYACPTPFPACAPPLPPFASVGPPTWTGVVCCYPVTTCGF
jgi:hypothetical protein